MHGARWKWMVAAFVASVGAACSAVLGLEPPPVPDAGMGEGGAGGDAQAIPVCAPLDAGDGGTYSPLTPVTGVWDSLFVASLDLGFANKTFSGGTFDGRYVYFAGHGGAYVARYDTTTGAGGFAEPASWSIYDLVGPLLPVGTLAGFAGAVYDGRYVYFVPSPEGATLSVVARFDTTVATLGTPGAWALFTTGDLLPPPDGGPVASGFAGGGFDGRYLYLVPHDDGVPDGLAVRYDTTEPDAGHVDAGHVGEAGDAGPSDFDDAGRWSTYDIATQNSIATGFFGAAFDGTSLYFAPQSNGYPGGSGVVAQLRAAGVFTSRTAWTMFDLTTVNGLASDFEGAGFDGRYVYFAPREYGIVARFDTTLGPITSASSWSTYDVTRVVSNAAAAQFTGAAYDGRFVYFIPGSLTSGTVARYDTLSTFASDCAWSTVDLTQLDVDGSTSEGFSGAVFDGEYLYLIPAAYGVVARFHAKTPASMPALPFFHGSFF